MSYGTGFLGAGIRSVRAQGWRCDARGGSYINWLAGAECHEKVKSESSSGREIL